MLVHAVYAGIGSTYQAVLQSSYAGGVPEYTLGQVKPCTSGSPERNQVCQGYKAVRNKRLSLRWQSRSANH